MIIALLKFTEIWLQTSLKLNSLLLFSDTTEQVFYRKPILIFRYDGGKYWSIEANM
jgi:predicted HTH transcriptional regulator